MRTMTNEKEFFSINGFKIQETLKIHSDATSNMAVRQMISSFGFRADRELASRLIGMARE